MEEKRMVLVRKNLDLKRSRKCKYGRKKSGACKKKPGPKRSRKVKMAFRFPVPEKCKRKRPVYLNPVLMKDPYAPYNLCFLNDKGKENIWIPIALQIGSEPIELFGFYIFVITGQEPDTVYISAESAKSRKSREYYVCGGSLDKNNIAIAKELDKKTPTRKKKTIHHTNVGKGNDVICAGEISFSGKSVLSINNKSGHYRPRENCLNYALCLLEEIGYGVEGVKISRQSTDLSKLVIVTYGKDRAAEYGYFRLENS